VLSDRCAEARLSLISKAAGAHSAISLSHLSQPTRQTRRADHTSFIPISARTDVHKYSFFPHTLLDWNTLSAEFVSSTRCLWVSWSGRLSHDTPAVKGDAHCWILAEELKSEEEEYGLYW